MSTFYFHKKIIKKHKQLYVLIKKLYLFVQFYNNINNNSSWNLGVMVMSYF